MGAESAGMEEELRDAFRQGDVPAVHKIPFGDWDAKLGRWLYQHGVFDRETEHLGEGEIWARLVSMGGRGTTWLVEALVDEEWVARQPSMRKGLPVSDHQLMGGLDGRPLAQLVVNRYQRDDGVDVLLIERVQILRGPQELEHGEELEVRSELVEMVGEWGKSNNVPVYLIRPEVMREVNPSLREKTIGRNYYDPVDARDPRLWDTVRLRVDGPMFMDKGNREDAWFLYKGDPSSAGLEEDEPWEGKSESWLKGAADAGIRNYAERLRVLGGSADLFLEEARVVGGLPLSPEAFLNAAGDQPALLSSGRPLRFGGGLLYHGGRDFKAMLAAGGVSGSQAGPVELTRVPHVSVPAYVLSSNPPDPFILVLPTPVFNERLARGEAGIQIVPVSNDCWTSLYRGVSLEEILSIPGAEIWVTEDTWDFVMEVLAGMNTDPAAAALRPALQALGGRVKRILDLWYESQDPLERVSAGSKHIASYVSVRDLVKEIPAFELADPAAGLEERAPVRRWDEAESARRRERVKEIIGGSFPGDLSNEWSSYPQPSLKMMRPSEDGTIMNPDDFRAGYGIERWNGWREVSEFHKVPEALFVRAGPLFFVDTRLRGSAGEALSAELGGNLLWVDQLEESSVANLLVSTKGLYGSYTVVTLLALLQENAPLPERIIEAGVADGIPLLVAAALGARFLEGFDILPGKVEQARRNFEANGFPRDRVNLFAGDLSKKEGVVSRLLFGGKKTGLISDIGTWEGLWEVNNIDSVELAEAAGGASLLVLSGYPKRGMWRAPAQLIQDQVKLAGMGYQADPLWASYFDGTSGQHALAWTARRAAGLEEFTAARWTEQKAQEMSRRLVDRLGGRLGRPLVDVNAAYPGPLSLSYRADPLGQPSNTYGMEQWRDPSEQSFHFFRVGFLFFLNEERYALLDEPLRREFGGNLIRVKDLKESALADWGLGFYTAAAITALMGSVFDGKAVIDVGAGEGLLSLAAARLGAGFIELIEKDKRLAGLARENLELNGLRDGVNFQVIQEDAADSAAVRRRLKPTPEETAVICNIGTWPELYNITNADVIDALSVWGRNVVLFVGGGYSWDGDAVPASLVDLRMSWAQDRQRIAGLGFEVTGDAEFLLPPRDGIPLTHITAWAAALPAVRERLPAGLEELVVMTAAEFGERYVGAEAAAFGRDGATLEGLAGRSDVRATVMDLPKYLYVYVQGKALFLKVQETLPQKSPPGSRFAVLQTPRADWPRGMGLIYQDPMVTPLSPDQNPLGFPVHDLRLEDAHALDPLVVLAQIFRSRLGIPESAYLGVMLFEDAEGQAKLVLFSA